MAVIFHPASPRAVWTTTILESGLSSPARTVARNSCHVRLPSTGATRSQHPVSTSEKSSRPAALCARGPGGIGPAGAPAGGARHAARHASRATAATGTPRSGPARGGHGARPSVTRVTGHSRTAGRHRRHQADRQADRRAPRAEEHAPQQQDRQEREQCPLQRLDDALVPVLVHHAEEQHAGRRQQHAGPREYPRVRAPPHERPREGRHRLDARTALAVAALEARTDRAAAGGRLPARGGRPSDPSAEPRATAQAAPTAARLGKGPPAAASGERLWRDRALNRP